MAKIDASKIPAGFKLYTLRSGSIQWSEDIGDTVTVENYVGRVAFIGKYLIAGLAPSNVLVNDDGSSLTASAKSFTVAAATTAALTTTYFNGSGTPGIGASLTEIGNGALVLDGYTAVLNDRILVKDQAVSAENGIYVVQAIGDGSNPFVLVRATDADLFTEMYPGSTVTVTNGTTQQNNVYKMDSLTVSTAIVGTDNVTFTLLVSGSVASSIGISDGTYIYNVVFESSASNIIRENNMAIPKILIPRWLLPDNEYLVEMLIPNSVTNATVLTTLTS